MTTLPLLQQLGHTLIRASAGTGKTHALTTRYAEWVAAGVEPQNIIAITFTRRAAGELRTRIRAALVAQGAGEAVLGQLAHAPITNFHGLSLTLCEEFWPGGITEGALHVLGESGEDKQLFVESCESAWFAGDPAIAAALRTLGPWMRLDGAMMGQLWDAIGRARESAEPLRLELFGHYDAQAKGALVHEHLLQLREHILSHEDALTTPVGLRALAHLKQTPVPTWGASTDERSTDHIEIWRTGWHAVFAPINRKGRMGQVITAEQMQSVATLLPSVAAEAQAQRMAPALYALTEAAWQAYTRAKAARGALDFADLIERAIAILTERPEAMRLVRERTRAVLVDEAQDTNALQRQLVRLLAGLDGPDAQRTAAATTVVGDWKQAIYTFRGADPQNFARFADDLSHLGGSQQSLATSYRSVQPLVAGINALGQHLFEGSYEPLQAQPLISQTEASGAAPKTLGAPATAHPLLRPGMHWLAVRRADGGKLTLADDAWATAQHVATLIQEGIAPADIAVLMANVRAPAPTYLKAFSDAGVPLIASGTGDLLEQPHVAELLALCRWLVDPSPSSELDGAIALSSPLFALDDDALFFLWGSEGRQLQRTQALRAGQWDLLAEGAPPEILSSALQRACALMPELIAHAVQLPMPLLLERLDELLHVRALYGAEPAGRAQRMADYDALMYLTEQAYRRGHSTVADTVSQLSWRKAQGFTTAQGEALAGHQQAVLLSSVHSSKGLQYPVVVLPALERRGQNNTGSLVFERQLGMAFALQAGRERLRPQRFLDASSTMHEGQQAELKRLVYVAVTRAKRQVIFVGPPPEACRNTGFAGIIAPWAASLPSALHVHEAIAGELPGGAPPKPALWQPEDAAAHARLMQLVAPAHNVALPKGTAFQISVSALLDAWQMHTSGEDDSSALDESAPDPAADAPSHAVESGAPQSLSHKQAGILAHALLGRLDDLPSFKDTHAFLQAEAQFLGHDPRHSSVQAVCADLAHALSTSMGRMLATAAAGHRRFEVDFIWRGDVLGHPVQLRGQVDALLQQPSGLTLIDFKYGWPSKINRRYAQQLQIYTWALTALWGAQGPSHGHIWYLKAPRSTAAVAIDPAACAWVPEALQAWVEQHRSAQVGARSA